jgi:hypothetical protein
MHLSPEAILFLVNKRRKTLKSLSICVAWLKCRSFAYANVIELQCNFIRQAGRNIPYERTESIRLGKRDVPVSGIIQVVASLIGTFCTDQRPRNRGGGGGGGGSTVPPTFLKTPKCALFESWNVPYIAKCCFGVQNVYLRYNGISYSEKRTSNYVWKFSCYDIINIHPILPISCNSQCINQGVPWLLN